MTNIAANLPLDLTGTSATNLITQEYQSIGGGGKGVIRPNWGSFFKKSLKIFNVSGANVVAELTYGTDYVFAELDTAATEESGLVVYQAILILNTLLTSTFSLTYQAVGGEGNQNKSLIYTEAYAAAFGSPLTFDSLANKPATFPPVHHTHDIADVYGIEWLTTWVNRLGNATNGFLAGDSNLDIQYRLSSFSAAATSSIYSLGNAVNSHISNSGYPHSYTAAMIGFGNLGNYGFTDLGGGTPYYASPITIVNALTTLPSQNTAMMNAHKANTSNPHADTANTIGLGNVENHPILLTYTAGRYAPLLANGASVFYLNPYVTAGIVRDYTADSYTSIYTNPVNGISNGSTGTLDIVNSVINNVNNIVNTVNTDLNNIATNEAAILSNAAQATASINRFKVVNDNYAYAAMLTQISQYDYAQSATNSSVSPDGYWPVPENLNGLYLWLSANNPANTLFPDVNGNIRVTNLVDRSIYRRVYSAEAHNAPIYESSSDIDGAEAGITKGNVLKFTNGQGLILSSGNAPTLSPGMTVFAIYKTPAPGDVFTLLSSQSSGNGINVYGNSSGSLVNINSTGWSALRTPAGSEVPQASTLFCGVISNNSEEDSWCVSNTALANQTYPRGVNTPAGQWPANGYVGDSLDLVGNVNYGIPNIGEFAELIIYNRVLSGAEATAVLEYLRLRYNHSTALAINYSSLNAF